MTNYIPELDEFRSVRRWMEDGQDLRALLLAQEMAADSYIQLARSLPGAAGTTLHRLAREARGHAACLEGICVLVTGEAPDIWTPVPEPGPAAAVLRKCYGRAMRTLAVYEARSRDPEYGPVFARLAHQQQDHCRAILELLGTLGRP